MSAYSTDLAAQLRRLEATRDDRSKQELSALSPDDEVALWQGFHPDYKRSATAEIPFGPSRGQRAARELVDLLCAPSRIDPASLRLDDAIEADVLVVGAGGAGLTAALAAEAEGARVLLCTKLRAGDSNTAMATGLACALRPDDSPVLHFLDTLEGGHFENVPELVEALVRDAPLAVAWLEELGVAFARNAAGDLQMRESEGRFGGHTRPRGLFAAEGLGGLEIIRTIREEVLNRHDRIRILPFHPIVECILDRGGACAGGVLLDLDTDRHVVVCARTTILATGGMGRCHCNGFPTTNHIGATADGIIVGYRAGARLTHMDSVQYHPTGAIWPAPTVGWLLSEVFRASGAHLVNANGERFVREGERRDTVASAIIRECEQGRGIRTPSGLLGVWLDTPLVVGTALGREMMAARDRFLGFGVDLWKEPVLVYPTQHYQNGGLVIDAQGRTTVDGLYAAGEVAGGVHGRNRLGGNSLTDVFVFGRRAGAAAARDGKQRPAPAELSLDHVVAHQRGAEAGDAMRSPLLFPTYRGAS